MGYKMKRGNSAVPFKELGSSPAKQAIGGGPGEAVEHYKKFKEGKAKGSTITELKQSRANDIKKVKGDTVKISKKDVLKQMKTTGTKLPYSSIKNALKTSIKAAGKIAKFVPGVAGLVLGATKTSNADQPKEGKGKVKYEGGEIDFTKTR